GQLVLLGVGVFDVADRVLQLADVGGDAFVALAALAHGPLDRLAFADRGLPLGRDLGQVIGPAEGGARAVGAVDHHDIAVRQAEARVQGGDRRVVPLLDLAQVDVGQQGAGQAQLPGLDAVDIDHGHRATD